MLRNGLILAIGVLVVSGITIFSISAEESLIPSWIKNTAGFWVNDQISDAEFITALQYLVKQKILIIPQENTVEIEVTKPPPPDEKITLGLSVNAYQEGDTIVVFGTTDEIIGNTPMTTIQIFHAGNLVDISQAIVNNYGEFSYTVLATGPLWQSDGTYTVRVTYGSDNMVETNFEFFTKETEPSTPSSVKETKPQSNDCSGNARCFTGEVTQIIDGDTITVAGQSIRFALTSTPELNEYGGVEARNFIEDICPVGSSALVDEDDGQTEGSYGRIVGVIYCNGVNLNEAVLDDGLGYLSSGFCYKSEFKTHAWAQRHGC